VRIFEYYQVSIVLDVGANEGQYALKLREYGYRGQITSFEPQPHVHSVLRSHGEKDKAWTIAPPMGVGAEKGRLSLNIFTSSDMSSFKTLSPEAQLTLSGEKTVQKVEVEVNTIDGLAPNYKIVDDRTALKIDTQGFEYEVLRGAEETLKRIAIVQM
jgi:FkbM family methyltransferase